MTDLVDGAIDLLPAMLRADDTGRSKAGGSRLVDRPAAAASFSFKLRLDFDGSNCSFSPKRQSMTKKSKLKKKLVLTHLSVLGCASWIKQQKTISFIFGRLTELLGRLPSKESRSG
jgi:hypothetical protein